MPSEGCQPTLYRMSSTSREKDGVLEAPSLSWLYPQAGRRFSLPLGKSAHGSHGSSSPAYRDCEPACAEDLPILVYSRNRIIVSLNLVEEWGLASGINAHQIVEIRELIQRMRRCYRISRQQGTPRRVSAFLTAFTTASAITQAASVPTLFTSADKLPVPMQKLTSPSPRVWMGLMVLA